MWQIVPQFRMAFSAAQSGGSIGSLASVKSRFFDVAAINADVARANQKVLSLAGRDIWQADRKSIRKPPPFKIKDMTPDERKAFRIRQAIAKRQGRPAPQRPRTQQGAPAGHAPYDRTGLLRQHIYYAFDPATDSVVVGAALLSAKGVDVPEVLESGGAATITYGPNTGKKVQLAARQHTTPAYEKLKPKISQLWANRL